MIYRPLSILQLAVASSILFSASARAGGIFDVRDLGATGVKADDARPALQRAIDECAAAGGGTVLVPPGEYTSGTLVLRSHVTIRVEGGATIFSSKREGAFPQDALFYGDGLENVTLEGRG